jgi:hypothetical protein
MHCKKRTSSGRKGEVCSSKSQSDTRINRKRKSSTFFRSYLCFADLINRVQSKSHNRISSSWSMTFLSTSTINSLDGVTCL